MSSPPKEAPVRAWAWALALPALLVPAVNPDLFWHLAAGRWMAESRALPRRDAFSFTLEGAPWLDFEWGSQLLFYASHALLGLWGPWLLKGALLLAAALLLSRALPREPVSRAVLLGLWWTAAVAAADARPELFSLALFCALLWGLENWRRRELGFGRPALAAAAALFALWANLHAGFFAGLAALGLYAAGEALDRNWRRAAEGLSVFAAGAAGSLLNPYGAGPWSAAWEHWQDRAALARFIKEWHPMGLDNPFQLPFHFIAALFVLVFVVRRFKRERVPWGPALLAFYFLTAAVSHRRAAVYFHPAALVFLGAAAGLEGRALRRAGAALLAAAALFLAVLIPRARWTPPFNPKFVPEGAARFLAEHREIVPARLYNEWEWGGYLAWTLPERKVFVDGRYLFHPLLPEISRAAQDPRAWAAFLERRGLDAALVHNLDFMLDTQKRYPDGALKAFKRPWYTAYFPLERWALVHWNAQTLLFVSRRAVPAAWLKENEYRWHRPKDDEALEEGLERGEVPPKALEAERARHARAAR